MRKGSAHGFQMRRGDKDGRANRPQKLNVIGRIAEAGGLLVAKY